MSEQPAARDTTFDNIKPEQLWLDFSNTRREGYLSVILSINGIEMVIEEFYIPGLSLNEGITLCGRNLTWILKMSEPKSTGPSDGGA